MVLFYVIFLFLILQRLIELKIAANNEKWMKQRGGIEVGKEHYKYFVILHVSFFCSLLIEVNMISHLQFNKFFFSLFLISQLGRLWCIYSLGRFWNTKIIVLPKVVLIKKGPYKYVKHPNYIIVFIELFSIPLIFGAYVTAFLFPFFHLFLLTIRIPKEERALRRSIGYK